MTRLAYALFALIAYVIFFATFLYLIAFVGGFGIVPRSIDHPAGTGSVGLAIAVDIALVAIFGVQHSVMARSGFKAAWTRFMPAPIERSGYMIFACAALILIYALWQPIPATLWDASGTFAEPALWALFGLGWLIVLLSTFLINHFELFGLTQVWNHWRGAAPAAPVFRKPLFYRLVRHPLYSGFLIAFWATPKMSVGHLLFAAAMTAYILIAIEYEERDLVRLFGSDYEAYQKSVGKLSPRL